MKKTLLTVVLAVLLLLNMGIIFYNSHKTAEQSTTASTQISSAILNTDETNTLSVYNMQRFDEVLREVSHAIEFFPMGILCVLLCLLHIAGTKRYLISAIISFLFVLAYGVSDEIHQMFVPGRAFQFDDVVIDCVGGIVGIAAGVVVFLLLSKIKSAKNIKAE